MGEISQEQYDMLKDIPKDERSKFVAAFERLEKDTAKDYRKYVAIALEKFKALNDIKEKDIIEIAFDAIWLDKEVSNLQITENIKFTCKRKASSILEIKKVKFYFNSADNTFFQRGLGQKESLWFDVIKEYMRLSELEDNKSLTIPYEDDETDRDITIKTLDEFISPKYQIRLFSESLGDDTLAFTVLNSDEWKELENSVGKEKLDFFFLTFWGQYRC